MFKVGDEVLYKRHKNDSNPLKGKVIERNEMRAYYCKETYPIAVEFRTGDQVAFTASGCEFEWDEDKTDKEHIIHAGALVDRSGLERLKAELQKPKAEYKPSSPKSEEPYTFLKGDVVAHKYNPDLYGIGVVHSVGFSLIEVTWLGIRGQKVKYTAQGSSIQNGKSLPPEIKLLIKQPSAEEFLEFKIGDRVEAYGCSGRVVNLVDSTHFVAVLFDSGNRQTFTSQGMAMSWHKEPSLKHKIVSPEEAWNDKPQPEKEDLATVTMYQAVHPGVERSTVRSQLFETVKELVDYYDNGVVGYTEVKVKKL